MTPTTKKQAAEAAPETPEPLPGEDGWEPRKPSSREIKAGEHVLYRGDSGPVFALVMAGGTGEAEVLLLRDGEIPRSRAVVVYDTAADAERGAQEGRQHVAWLPA